LLLSRYVDSKCCIAKQNNLCWISECLVAHKNKHLVQGGNWTLNTFLYFLRFIVFSFESKNCFVFSLNRLSVIVLLQFMQLSLTFKASMPWGISLMVLGKQMQACNGAIDNKAVSTFFPLCLKRQFPPPLVLGTTRVEKLSVKLGSHKVVL